MGATSYALLTSGSDSSDATSYITASIDPKPRQLILAAVLTDKDAALATPTLTGCGLTWTSITTVDFNTAAAATKRLILYRAMGAAPTQGPVTISFGTTEMDNCSWIIAALDKVNTGGTGGASAVVQSATNRSDSANSLTVTLAAGTAANATFAVFAANKNPGLTPESGYTEVADVTCSSPAVELAAEFRSTFDTTPVMTTTDATSKALAGIAIEVLEGGAATAVERSVTGKGTASRTVAVGAASTRSQTGTGTVSLEVSVRTPKSTIPVMIVELGLAAQPLDPLATVSWQIVSHLLVDVDIKRGRKHELNRFEAGTATVVLKNYNREFDPTYTASPYYPNIRPMRRIRIRALYGGVSYARFTGYVLDFQPEWDIKGRAVCVLRCVDAFALLADLRPSSGPYFYEAMLRQPSLYWRLDETVGQQAVDSSGRARTGTYDPAVTRSIQGPLVAEPKNIGIGLGPGTKVDAGDTLGFERTDEFSFSLWAKTTEAGSILVQKMSGTTGYELRLQEGKPELRVRDGTGTYVAARAATKVHNGQWHHVIVTYSGSATSDGAVFWIDGVSGGKQDTGSNSVAGTIINAATFKLGNDPDTATQVKDLIVYEHALTQADAKALYRAGTTPWVGQRSSDRVNAVLDLLGWPGDDRDIRTGVATLSALTDLSNPLEHLNAVADTEVGGLYINESGQVAFDDRYVNIQDSEVVLTYGDAPIEETVVPVLQSTQTATTDDGLNVAVNVPASTADGDLLVATICTNVAAAPTAPAGWTLIQGTAANSMSYHSYYRIASSEPASYQWSQVSNRDWSGAISRITGHDPDAPINVSGTQGTASSTTITAPTVTTTVANCLALFCGGYRGTNQTFSGYSGTYVESWEIAVALVTASAFGATASAASAGALGAATCTGTGAAVASVGQQIAIAPDPVPTAEYRYAAFSPSQDSDQLHTEFHVTRSGGATQVIADETDTDDYGPRVLERAGLWSDDEQARSIGDKLQDRYATPKLRFDSLGFNERGVDQDGLWVAILARVLNRERVRVRNRPPPSGSETLEQECWIESIAESYRADPLRVRFTFGLVPADDAKTYWVLGESQLGVDTKLAF